MRYVPKKKHKLRLSVIVVLALIVQMLTPFSMANAIDQGDVTAQAIVNPNDITSKTEFVTIDLRKETDGIITPDTLLDGSQLKGDINFGLFFRFEFDSSEAYEIQPGDFIKFSVPPQIDLGQDQTFALIDSGDLLATAKYYANSNEIEIVFEPISHGEYIPWGEFWFFGGFDESEFGVTNPEIIDFTVLGESISVNVDRDTTTPTPTPNPEATPPTITKSGARGSSWDDINWTITVDTHDTNVSNWKITDVLPSTLELVDTGAITVKEPLNGNDISHNLNISLSASSNELEIDFDGYTDPIEGKYIITIPTKLSATALKEAYPTTSGDDTFSVENTAVLHYNDEPEITSNEATVPVTIQLLEKKQEGTISGVINHDGTISWKITVNKDQIPLLGVKITDIVDLDMEFVTGSVTISGAPSATHNITDNKLSIDLGNITTEVTITYDTKVNTNYFKGNISKTFNNTANMKWNGGPTTGIEYGAGVGIQSSVIAKSGTYNRSTGLITWTIVVNSNNMTLTSPVVTDVIPDTQRYVADSFKIKKQGEATSTPVNDTLVYNNTDTLTYTFPGNISEQYTITFETLVLDADHRKTNTDNTYLNSAVIKSLTLDGGKETASTSTPVESKVLSKSNKGYDYSSREITWEITVNQNKILLEDAVITDRLLKGLTYTPGSLVVNGTPVPDSSSNFSYVATSSDPTYAGTITYTFPPAITTEQTISFRTTVTDLTMFSGQNDGFSVGNSAILTLTDKDTGIDIPITETESANQPIENNIVSKRAKYTPGNDYIEWIVDINSNAVNLNGLLGVSGFSLIDTLSPGLELDTSSVKLVKYAGVNSAGDPINPDDISDEFTKDNIVYDANTNQFKFVFPAGLIDDHPFQLSFTTDVVAPGTYSNSISLEGEQQIYNSDAGSTPVSWNVAGGGIGRAGKITVFKKDTDGNLLPGATFELIDGYGNIVKTGVTNADGVVIFKAVALEKQFKVREAAPPEGYIRNGEATKVGTTGVLPYVEPNTIAVNLSNSDKDQKFEFTNEQVKATVTFEKHFEGIAAGSTLPEATFGLYPRGLSSPSDLIMSAKNDTSTGKVSFNDVPHGNYDIREINVPTGYVTPSGPVVTVDIATDEATHGSTIDKGVVDNNLIKTNIKFIKVIQGSNTGLGGAVFRLHNSEREYEATSAELTGLVEFKDVLAGTYTLSEKKAPSGYVPITVDITTVTVNETDHSIPIVLTNVPNELIQTTIEFVKQDGKDKLLEGAEFGLYEGSTEIQRKTTGTDGKITFTNVGAGIYSIKEIKAPEGYLPIEGIVYDNVEITAANHNIPKKLDPVINTLIEAKIQFVKVGDKGELLEGAVFGLYTSGALEGSAPIKQATSDVKGIVTFDDVVKGKYDIREITPPTGYNPLTTYVAADLEINELNDFDSTTNIVDLGNVINNIIKGNIEFVKVDKINSKPLKNARFALYAANDTKFDKEIATAISDINGLVSFENVEYGEYTIIEIAPPSGYYKSKETLSVAIRTEGATYPLGNFENVKIPDNAVEGTIEINKVNELGDPLAGAKFGLYNVIGYLVAEGVTNSSGIVRFAPVEEGVYTVEELEAPTNYVKSDQVENVTISSDSNYVKLTFVNERSSDAPWPNVSVQKVDDAGVALAGVKFALYKATDTAFTTPIANSITNASGVATFTNILPGKYVVKEIEALKGYVLSIVTLPVTVTDDVKTHNAGTVENRLIRNDIVVNKVNEYDEPLKGAEFGLYDKDGELVEVAVSDSDGIADFKNIPYGSYRLKEIIAPDLYEKSDEVIAINITIDGVTQAFTFVNKKVNVSGVKPEKPDTDSNVPGGTPETGSTETGIESNKPGINVGTNTGGANQSNQLPKTGDSIATMMWLFVGSGLAIVALLLVGRRRTHKQ